MNTREKEKITTKTKLKETLLTPRFYTTNFKEIASLNFSSSNAEIKTIVDELRLDYNKDFFIRDQEFLNIAKRFDKETEQSFIEFLERSCTAEFSGFLLYKEIARNLIKRNPLLAEGFAFMSRDEARHAGFLNKALSDFNISLNLGFLTKTRKYIFFPPKFIFYATYLSEKIGYWRYITIYRYLERNPNNRAYPLFKFFENWCQDENRHSEFFSVILKSQRSYLNTRASEFWCKFFLLSVFLTMYLNDAQKDFFYSSIGLNTKTFDKHVIIKTNQSAESLFPVVLDTQNPKFFDLFDSCALINKKLELINEQKCMWKPIKFLQKMKLYFCMGQNILHLYFLPTIKMKKTL